MKNKTLIYCLDCKKKTPHIGKLSAMLDGAMVCDVCRRQNSICQLTKEGDKNFIKQSIKHIWYEWDEDEKFKDKHIEPEIGYSLLMGTENEFFTWMTTPITKITHNEPGYVSFETKNSKYNLRYAID